MGSCREDDWSCCRPHPPVAACSRRNAAHGEFRDAMPTYHEGAADARRTVRDGHVRFGLILGTRRQLQADEGRRGRGVYLRGGKEGIPYLRKHRGPYRRDHGHIQHGEVNYSTLLDTFFAQHNPLSNCTEDRQYMSGVWWHNLAQQAEIEQKVSAIEAIKARGFDPPIAHTVVTYRAPLTPMYRAEEYHQNFYEKNNMVTYG